MSRKKRAEAKPPTKQEAQVIERSFRTETVELGWLYFLHRDNGAPRTNSSDGLPLDIQMGRCRREEIDLVSLHNDMLERIAKVADDLRFQRALAVRLSEGYSQEQIELARTVAARGGIAPLDYPPLLALIDEIAKTIRPSASMRDAWQEKAQKYGTPWAYIEEQVRGKRAPLREAAKPKATPTEKKS